MHPRAFILWACFFGLVPAVGCGVDGFEGDSSLPYEPNEGGGWNGPHASSGWSSGGNTSEPSRSNGGLSFAAGRRGHEHAAQPPSGGSGSTSGSPQQSGGTSPLPAAGSSSAGGPEGAGGSSFVPDDATGGSTLGTAGAASVPVTPPGQYLFSEYVEGSSNNKAIEIYAVVGGALDTCSLLVYLNGNPTPSRTIALSGTLAEGELLVLCDARFPEPLLCDRTAALSFNGNDALLLVCGDELHDSIGRIEERIKAYWGKADVRTAGMTLRRQCAVREGDRDPSDPYDPSYEWEALELDLFAGLGTHCTEPTDPSEGSPGAAGAGGNAGSSGEGGSAGPAGTGGTAGLAGATGAAGLADSAGAGGATGAAEADESAED